MVIRLMELMIQTEQDDDLNSHTIEVHTFENREATQLEVEGEAEAGKRRSVKETQVVQISTLRKTDGGDAI